MNKSFKSVMDIINITIIIIIIILFSILTFSLANIKYISKQSINSVNNILENELLISESSAKILIHVLNLRRYEKDVFINIDNKEKVKEYYKKWSNEKDNLLQKISQLDNLLLSGDKKESITKMKNNLLIYIENFINIYSKIESGTLNTTKECNDTIDKYKPYIRELEGISLNIYEYGIENTKIKSTSLKNYLLSFVNRNTIITSFIGIFAFITFLSLFIFIRNKISYLVKYANEELSKISNKITIETDKIYSIIKNLSESSSLSKTSIKDIKILIDNLQANIESSSKFINNTNILLSESINELEKTKSELNEMINSLNLMLDYNKKMQNIVNFIDDISFQTNILALNASVEAARAGAIGKGFEVVAEQVKHLASKSADSAKETTELLEHTNNFSFETSNRMQKLKNLLIKSAEDLKQTSSSMSEIKNLSEDQIKNINNISKDINLINDTIKTNYTISNNLSTMVNEFKDNTINLKKIVDLLNYLMIGNKSFKYPQKILNNNKKHYLNKNY